MQIQGKKFQSGQAMSEFIAAMALFIPLVFGVIYAGKYADIKHQAIQASRYAAMERALDPRAHESSGVIADETVARFFRDAGQHAIALNEQAQGATAGDENPNWSQINGDPMLGSYADIKVKFSKKSYDSSLLGLVVNPTTLSFNGLTTGYGNSADGNQVDVEVPVANITHWLPLSNINLTLTASTVMAGDSWSAAGTKDVADHFTMFSDTGKDPLLIGLQVALEPYIVPLNDTLLPPQFGCVKPDVVPHYATNGSKYDSNDNSVSPGNPNDKCF